MACRSAADLERLIGRAEAVLLLTPPDARAELVVRCAAAGRPILMEKPVERTTAAALWLVERCEAAGVTLGIVLQHRFRESSERLRRLLARGCLGEPVVVELAIPWWRPQAYYDAPGRGTLARDGGGVLLTQAIHSLDLMQSLSARWPRSRPSPARPGCTEMEAEDVVGAGLVFANGALGSLYATTAAFPGRPERLAITGTAGAAVLEAGTLELRYLDGRRETARRGYGQRRDRRPDGLPARLAQGTDPRFPGRARGGPGAADHTAARRCGCTGSSTPSCSPPATADASS